MIRFYGLGGVIVFALWVYCLIDCISTDQVLVRNLPKPMWVLVIIFVPLVGSVAWLVAGRPEQAGFTPGNSRSSPTRRPALPPRSAGPEDSPEFMTNLEKRRLRAWEEELRRREEELHRGEGDEEP